MLEEFVVAHRSEIIIRCQGKVAKRSSPPVTREEIDHGVPMFLDELTAELREGLSPNPDISKTAARHGHDLWQRGFSPSQVVHAYGDVCQSITEMAIEQAAPISSDDFRMLNRCLDDAIASAITQYGDERDSAATGELTDERQRFESLVMELTTHIVASRLAFQAIQEGKVGVAGSTGMLLDRSLKGVEDLQKRLLAELSNSAQKTPGPSAGTTATD